MADVIYVPKSDILDLITEENEAGGFTDYSNYSNLWDTVDDMPAADVQPVKHGRWLETHISFCNLIPEDKKEEGHSFFMAEMKCSCCKKYNTVTFALSLNKPNFCHHCGARMDLNSVTHDRCSNYMDCDGNCFIDDTPCDCDGNIEKCKGR